MTSESRERKHSTRIASVTSTQSSPSDRNGNIGTGEVNPPRTLAGRQNLAITLVMLAALLCVVSIGTTGPIAADGDEPDPQIVADVQSYAQETQHGYDHVLRWMRVLQTLGALEGMTAAEARDNAERFLAERWDPVVEELEQLESAADGYEPDEQLVADVESYARQTQHGYDHVLRWMRVLTAFGVIEDMTASEAHANADKQIAARWNPVVEELQKLESAASEPESDPNLQANRAPQVNTGAASHSSFVTSGSAPRGVLVTKGFDGIFSDPDGDQLTYHLSAFDGPVQLVEKVGIFPDGVSDASAAESGRRLRSVMRVFFEADADDDWDSMLPPVPDVPVITVTLTATDPDGLTASVQGPFEIGWERQTVEAACELTAPSSVSGLGIERGAVISWTLPEDLDDACEVSGFVVGATGASGASLENWITDPEARSHVMRNIDPGEYQFYVRIRYEEGSSEEVITMSQTVHALCNISLTVESFASRMISGRWQSLTGAPSGCVWGPHVEFQMRRTGDDFFHPYGLFSNWPQPNPDLPAFIIAGLEQNASYDFKIVAVDAAGQTNESNVASATPSSTGDPNSPRNLRATANNSGEIQVNWDAPDSLGAGRSFAAWVVESTRLDNFGNPVAVDTAQLADRATTDHLLTSTSLVDGATYVVRVSARTTDSANNTHDAWSGAAPAVTARSEPLQIWLYDPDPKIGTWSGRLGRVWLNVTPNKRLERSDCHVNTDNVACPPGTLVSLAAAGQVTVSVDVTPAGGTSATFTGWEGEMGGPRAPRIAASGGNGRFLVEWTELAATALTHFGTLDAYVIQHRQGTSGTWTNTVITDTTKRSHTITGLSNGSNYQVRVRGRSANLEDHDDDPKSPDETVHRLGFTSDIMTVRTHILRHLPPHRPKDLRITAGDASLIVEWEPPEPDSRRSAAHAYQVRHRLRGSGADWTESPVILALPSHRICDAKACVNPRRYEITDLAPGQDYAVAIRARNAYGWSDWFGLHASNFPNGTKDETSPTFLSAVKPSGENTVVISFDENLDPNSVPAAERFSLTRPYNTGILVIRSATSVSISGTQLTLTFAQIESNATGVQYTSPNNNPLQDPYGNEVMDFKETFTRN